MGYDFNFGGGGSAGGGSGSVSFASVAETEAGLVTNKAVHPLGVRTAIDLATALVETSSASDASAKDVVSLGYGNRNGGAALSYSITGRVADATKNQTLDSLFFTRASSQYTVTITGATGTAVATVDHPDRCIVTHQGSNVFLLTKGSGAGLAQITFSDGIAKPVVVTRRFVGFVYLTTTTVSGAGTYASPYSAELQLTTWKDSLSPNVHGVVLPGIYRRVSTFDFSSGESGTDLLNKVVVYAAGAVSIRGSTVLPGAWTVVDPANNIWVYNTALTGPQIQTLYGGVDFNTMISGAQHGGFDTNGTTVLATTYNRYHVASPATVGGNRLTPRGIDETDLQLYTDAGIKEQLRFWHSPVDDFLYLVFDPAAFGGETDPNNLVWEIGSFRTVFSTNFTSKFMEFNGFDVRHNSSTAPGADGADSGTMAILRGSDITFNDCTFDKADYLTVFIGGFDSPQNGNFSQRLIFNNCYFGAGGAGIGTVYGSDESWKNAKGVWRQGHRFNNCTCEEALTRAFITDFTNSLKCIPGCYDVKFDRCIFKNCQGWFDESMGGNAFTNCVAINSAGFHIEVCKASYNEPNIVYNCLIYIESDFVNRHNAYAKFQIAGGIRIVGSANTVVLFNTIYGPIQGIVCESNNDTTRRGWGNVVMNNLAISTATWPVGSTVRADYVFQQPLNAHEGEKNIYRNNFLYHVGATQATVDHLERALQYRVKIREFSTATDVKTVVITDPQDLLCFPGFGFEPTRGLPYNYNVTQTYQGYGHIGDVEFVNLAAYDFALVKNTVAAGVGEKPAHGCDTTKLPTYL